MECNKKIHGPVAIFGFISSVECCHVLCLIMAVLLRDRKTLELCSVSKTSAQEAISGSARHALKLASMHPPLIWRIAQITERASQTLHLSFGRRFSHRRQHEDADWRGQTRSSRTKTAMKNTIYAPDSADKFLRCSVRGQPSKVSNLYLHMPSPRLL